MIYPRKIKTQILSQMDNDLIIVITGMRRVGKTFLLYDLFSGLKSKNKILIDLEKPEERAIFQEESFEAIKRNLEQTGLVLFEKIPGNKPSPNKRSYLFIDEVQLLPKINSAIKYLYDHYNLKIILTGSSSFYLKNLFTQSLAGRKIIFELFPLDFGEFLTFRRAYDGKWVDSLKDLLNLDTQMTRLKYQSLFEEHLEVGGFPQVALAKKKEDAYKLLKDILYSYLSIDVRTLSDFRGIDELEKVVKLLPSRIGQKLDYSKLSREIGISRPTLKNYLQFLKDTFVINTIYPYSKSKDREISAAPKLYFCDNGLGAALSLLSEGQRLENYVHNSLRPYFNLNYYQRKSGVEIDFILNQKVGLEVKVFGQESDYQRLKKITSDLEIKSCFAISQKVKGQEKGVLPAFLLGFLK